MTDPLTPEQLNALDPHAPPAVPGITFLRSTTTTRVQRWASSKPPETTVEHVARFAIAPGTLPDMTHQYGVQIFRPEFAVVTYERGRLNLVKVTGRRVLKSGGLSKSHAESRETEWGNVFSREPFNRDRLPAPLSAALAAYEYGVSLHVTEGNA